MREYSVLTGSDVNCLVCACVRRGKRARAEKETKRPRRCLPVEALGGRYAPRRDTLAQVLGRTIDGTREHFEA